MPSLQEIVVDMLLIPMFKLTWWLIKLAFKIATLPLRLLWKLFKMLRRRNAETKETNPAPANSLVSKERRGVVFGKCKKKYIIKPEEMDGHILTVGGVGSGKSACIAIPTLRAWQSSVFAIDIKGELYNATKEYCGNACVFNPLDDNAHGYDPYYFLRHSTNPAQESRAIAESIIPMPPDTKEPFWIESAQSILTGAILHSYHEGYTFLETMQITQRTPPQDLIRAISESGTAEAIYYINNFVDMDIKTLSGIVTEISRNIVPFVTDKHLISCFSRKKRITPALLERGTDIYIQIPEHLLRQWKPLLTLIINQFLTFFEQRDESTAAPILFLLDEFPRLGRIPAILDALATLRSKKITICPIIQSLAQLDMIYGREAREVIADTCAYTAILSATDANTQDYFSRRVGTFEKVKSSDTDQYSPYIHARQGKAKGHTTEEKRIIKPEEFATLKNIVLLTPFGFCRAEKAPYYVEEKR